MTYQVSATFNCVSMRKEPGQMLKAFEFYVQYIIEANELNELGVVVMQDWTMDLHRDARIMFANTVFVQQDDPNLDDTCQLAQGVADVVVLDCVSYMGLAQFFYDQMASKIVDGCFTNYAWVGEIIVQGSRFTGAKEDRK